MSDGTKKRGRPARYEDRPTMQLISFKADDATIAAIEALVDRQRALSPLGTDLGKMRSAAIRRGLQLAAELDREIEKK